MSCKHGALFKVSTSLIKYKRVWCSDYGSMMVSLNFMSADEDQKMDKNIRLSRSGSKKSYEMLQSYWAIHKLVEPIKIPVK